jgi:hypothetical protein
LRAGGNNLLKQLTLTPTLSLRQGEGDEKQLTLAPTLSFRQ